MRIYEKQFHRLFSMSLYKTLRLPLGQMTFSKDFVSDRRGDLYPVLARSEDCREQVAGNRYIVERGTVTRLMGRFFPYATYEVSFAGLCGTVGFLFQIADARADITYDGKWLQCTGTEPVAVAQPVGTLIVSCRPGAFDVYAASDNGITHLHTFASPAFDRSHSYVQFSNGTAALSVSGTARILSAGFYIDCGISQADIRPVRYEDGRVMVENGKIYLTASIRMEEEAFQGVFAWVPGTAGLELTGAVFYDSGDGFWCGDVAASVLYNRQNRQWYLWVCSFSHGHILGHAAFSGDPRFGVNVIDITLMPKTENSGFRDFAAMGQDEDPDFFYDALRDRWLMAICRIDPVTRGYRYVFFSSREPFAGYQYLGQGCEGAETGGSFVRLEEETVFVCGNDFHKTSDYRIYTQEGMVNAEFDYPDGGFRGWGTLIPVPMGSRTRYYWLTFDRHNGSTYNWSYGNLYCFEAM